MPRGGIVYGQMGSVFFEGEKIEAGVMTPSERELPKPTDEALAAVGKLKSLAARGGTDIAQDSIAVGFSESEPLVIAADGALRDCYLSGNIVVVAGDLIIASSCRLRDVVVLGGKVRIEDGFTGSLQVFARDSLNVEENVSLDYPSGLYSEKYVGIGDDSTVNGYVIVNPADEPNVRNANYVSSRLATVRGLVWVGGMAQLQGIVSGIAMLDKAVYYSRRGYYENMLSDVTIFENYDMAWPLWLDGPPERKEAKWVN
jgi:hypothetical protein